MFFEGASIPSFPLFTLDEIRGLPIKWSRVHESLRRLAALEENLMERM